ncbi:hypothetical protein C4N18_15260 (plasmid) [Fusobacterium varium ATCC 27725]|uniref:Uncharacterized protein n=1 Tax=Fusobacterium varium ATCC 27725 TaxID=469618 RepID=A0ABM6U899_FUSVA|nr:hypothetical protein C4N18_15260 [Fusobacterium varium ATCC 27725]
MRAFNKRNRPKHVTRGRYNKDFLFMNGFVQRDISNSRRIADLAYRTLLDKWVLIHYHKLAYHFKRRK